MQQNRTRNLEWTASLTVVIQVENKAPAAA